ncbi:hypothetical protein QMK19_03130 [Streptomyces sp. H10-C2]|uniref:hypothetical protein n=1 Tax=unclassified Streptomyces TaxID=2593676 RepID=UPI0024BA16CB|nr:MULTISPECIES: hypothetical protein [unclassified Streptomyces]MDJ0342178.1 hypothetical protein [Streptomyces sp. PH10-H1]MDJ0368692.1 hypothetical protein [Streptomyces sp. H10-C2]
MRIRDVPVRFERVPSLPHGGKLAVDELPGEDTVVWVRDDQNDEDVALLLCEIWALGGRPMLTELVEATMLAS